MTASFQILSNSSLASLRPYIIWYTDSVVRYTQIQIRISALHGRLTGRTRSCRLLLGPLHHYGTFRSRHIVAGRQLLSLSGGCTRQRLGHFSCLGRWITLFWKSVHTRAQNEDKQCVYDVERFIVFRDSGLACGVRATHVCYWETSGSSTQWRVWK